MNRPRIFNYFSPKRYKEVVAKEEECDQNIFITKVGNACVWTKMRRDDVKRHQNLLELHSSKKSFPCANSEYLFMINFIFIVVAFPLSNKMS
jgi:hypothetical protein